MSMPYPTDTWNEWTSLMAILTRRRARDSTIALKGTRIQLCVHVLVTMFIFYSCEYHSVELTALTNFYCLSPYDQMWQTVSSKYRQMDGR